MKIKVVIYVRVSTQEQAKEGYSIGEQIDRLKKYCEAMGWEIVRIFIDPGYSGGSTDRPGITEMIEFIETNNVDKVVVYKLDRLSRSQKDTLYLIEDVFLKHNTDFVSMNENFDTSTPFGRAMIGILAVFAQLEREQIKERMTMGKEARAKEGKWVGGRYIPIGYDYDSPNDLLVVNDYEAMQYTELCDRFLAGTSLRAIEQSFKEKGYHHKHGKWQSKTMRDVLRSKLYLGYISYEGKWYKAKHTPLITQHKYDKINQLLDQRAETYKHTGARAGVVTTYLGALLFCKHCGGKYGKDNNGRRDKNGNKVYKYVCYSRSKKMRPLIKDPNCKNKIWHLAELDNIVLGEIRKLALDPDYIRQIRKEKLEKTDEPNNMDILKREIKKLDDQISRFMDLYGVGKFTMEQVSSKVDPLNEQREALIKELEYLSRTVGALTEAQTIEILSTVNDVLERADFNEVRAMIESLIYYIELDNEDVTIHWRFA